MFETFFLTFALVQALVAVLGSALFYRLAPRSVWGWPLLGLTLFGAVWGVLFGLGAVWGDSFWYPQYAIAFGGLILLALYDRAVPPTPRIPGEAELEARATVEGGVRGAGIGSNPVLFFVLVVVAIFAFPLVAGAYLMWIAFTRRGVRGLYARIEGRGIHPKRRPRGRRD